VRLSKLAMTAGVSKTAPDFKKQNTAQAPSGDAAHA
jgi:hypothetical protein